MCDAGNGKTKKRMTFFFLFSDGKKRIVEVEKRLKGKGNEDWANDNYDFGKKENIYENFQKLFKLD